VTTLVSRTQRGISLPGQHDDLGISCAMLAFAAFQYRLR
jgi:hypothetical protein